MQTVARLIESNSEGDAGLDANEHSQALIQPNVAATNWADERRANCLKP